MIIFLTNIFIEKRDFGAFLNCYQKQIFIDIIVFVFNYGSGNKSIDFKIK